MIDAMKRLLPLILFAIFIFPVASWADELDDTTKTLNTKQQQLNSAKNTLEEAKKRESQLSGGMSALQASLATAIAEVGVKEAEVNKVLADLDVQEKTLKNQQVLRDIRVRALYKKLSSEKANEIVSLLNAENLVTFAKVADYQAQVLVEEERIILDLNNRVAEITKKRTELQGQLSQLADEKARAQQRVSNLNYQIALARNQQTSASNQIVNLNKDIKGLSEKQQQILAAKAAANNAGGSLGDKAPVVYNPAPPSHPDQKFAFASYGVPHRVGMSQYGAAGRAHSGQSHQQILGAYFHNVSVQTITMPETIEVSGVGSVPFEDRYLKLVREMPRSWPMEALKAQAILARTYAVKWINDGRGAICTTQSCQVYKHSDNPDSQDVYDQRWFQAVRETRGVILAQNNAPIGAYYAASNGGISQQSGQVWSTNLPYLKVAEDCDGSWPNNCYELRGGAGMRSPWFHKPWGDRTGKTESSTGNNCQTCNPWLTKAEITDLFNAALLYQANGNSTNGQNISPVASGGMSPEEVNNQLRNKGVEPIADFGGIDVYHDKPVGQTASVRIWGGNRGSVIIPANAVFAVVNLRAPGSIFLNSKLFDVIYP
jgi:peptidoglycan hydrolase-like amidase